LRPMSASAGEGFTRTALGAVVGGGAGVVGAVVSTCVALVDWVELLALPPPHPAAKHGPTASTITISSGVLVALTGCGAGTASCSA